MYYMEFLILKIEIGIRENVENTKLSQEKTILSFKVFLDWKTIDKTLYQDKFSYL